MSIDPRVLKPATNAACQSLLAGRLATMRADLAAIQASANNETKSSAGDKYETGRAMAQLEIEKLTVRIAEAQSQLSTLLHLADQLPTDQVGLGTLVQTDKAIIYLAVSLGKLLVDDTQVLVVSTAAPLGKALIGQKVGNQVSVAGANYLILAVV